MKNTCSLKEIMESDKGSVLGKFQTGLFSAQFMYDIFVTVAIIWVFIQNRGLYSEVKVLKNEVVDLKIRQSLREPIKVSDSLKEQGTAEGAERREVLNPGSLTLSDLLKQGIRGPPGPPGKDGLPGVPGRDGRDAVNFVAVEQHVKTTVSQAVDTEMQKVVQIAKSIPTVAGATYIRYGRSSCPSKSSMIYKGRLGGTEYDQKGGSSQHICMPDDPEYGPAVPPTSRMSRIAGAEYILPNNKLFGKDIYHQNAPCAVCQTNTRTTKLMIPAKLRCPDTWTLEYQGYLMSTDQMLETRTEYICVDSHAEAIPGMQGKIVGTEMFHATVTCPSLGYCPPYQDNRELVCVVCSK